MWPNPQKTVDLVIFTEEILNGKLQFCAVQALRISFVYSDYKSTFQETLKKIFFFSTPHKYPGIANRNVCVKTFMNGPSKICGRHPLKDLKWYGLPKVLFLKFYHINIFIVFCQQLWEKFSKLTEHGNIVSEHTVNISVEFIKQ